MGRKLDSFNSKVCSLLNAGGWAGKLVLASAAVAAGWQSAIALKIILIGTGLGLAAKGAEKLLTPTPRPLGQRAVAGIKIFFNSVTGKVLTGALLLGILKILSIVGVIASGPAVWAAIGIALFIFALVAWPEVSHLLSNGKSRLLDH